MNGTIQARKCSYTFEEHECVFKEEMKMYVCSDCIHKTYNRKCSCKPIMVKTCNECEKLKKLKYSTVCDMENLIYFMKEVCKNDMNDEVKEDDVIVHNDITDEMKYLTMIIEQTEIFLQKQKDKNMRKFATHK